MKTLRKGFGAFGSILAAILFEWAYVDTSKNSKAVSSRRRVYRRDARSEHQATPSIAAA